MILQNVFAYNVEFGSHFPDGVTKHYKLGLHEGQQMMSNADMDHGYFVLKSYSTFLSRHLDGLDVRGGDAKEAFISLTGFLAHAAFGMKHVDMLQEISYKTGIAPSQCGLYDAKGMDSWEYQAGDGWYDYLSYVKYDNEWLRIREEYIEMREEALTQQRTERIFKEGQGELPPKGQDFFYYWEDYDPTLQDLYFVIDDWS